jgi:hypothetical protein
MSERLQHRHLAAKDLGSELTQLLELSFGGELTVESE